MTKENAKTICDIVGKIDRYTKEKKFLENFRKLADYEMAVIRVYNTSGFSSRADDREMSVPKEVFGKVAEVIAEYYFGEIRKLETELEKL